MLKKTCIFIVMLFPLFSFAQTEETPEMDADEGPKVYVVFNEIGINSTSILSQFFKLDNETIPQSSYLLTYKMGFGKSALRFGGGFALSQDERFIDGSTDKVTSKESRFDVRVGYEYRVDLGKRWIGTFGLDAIVRTTLDELISDTSFDRVTLRTKGEGFGGGLAIGVQYYLTKKLMIGTEGAFYYLENKSTVENIFETSTQFNTDPEVSKLKQFENVLPSSIYLIFHF